MIAYRAVCCIFSHSTNRLVGGVPFAVCNNPPSYLRKRVGDWSKGLLVRHGPVVVAEQNQDPAICCQRFDLNADINGAKKASMSDPNADTSAQICPTVRSKVRTGPSVVRSDPDADIFGDLLTKSLTSNKTKDEFSFCRMRLCRQPSLQYYCLYVTTDRRFTKMGRGDPQLSLRDLHFSRVKTKGPSCCAGAHH